MHTYRTCAVAAAVAASVLPAHPSAASPPGQQEVAEAFIQAMKADDPAAAAARVSAAGPGGMSAVLRRPDYEYNGRSAWETVTGASCLGYICSAAGFPSTPEPAWYVVRRAGRWRVVAVAYRESADYLEFRGRFACTKRSVRVYNRSGRSATMVRRVPKWTPVWWARGAGWTNVAVDTGRTVPRVRMIYGFLPRPAARTTAACGD